MLRLASYRCERCGAKRDLQVHHKTYERLGVERDQDLEVVCADCHRQHHLISPADTLRVYLKLAREVVKAHPLGQFADLAEAMKLCCAKLHLPYDGDRIGRSLSLILGQPRTPEKPQTHRFDGRPIDPQALGKDEARRILLALQERFGVSGLVKTMRGTPNPKHIEIDGPIEGDGTIVDYASMLEGLK